MRLIQLLACGLLATLTASAPAQPGDAPAPPRAPAFPLRFDFDASRSRWSNQSPIDEHSVSEWTESCGRTGGGIHMKGTGGDASQLRIWRTVIPNPPIGQHLNLSAWAKGSGVDNLAAVCMQAHHSDSQYLAGFATSQLDKPLKGDFDWTRLDVTLDVPRGCTDVQVLLMLVGNGEVWFDDVELTLGGEATLIVPGVFEARGQFAVATTDPGTTTATLLLPMPLDYRDQAPLAYELLVEPPQRLQGTRFYEDQPGNWVVELKLHDLTTDTDTKVTWTSAVLVAPTDFSTVPKSVPLPAQWPQEARAWLRPTRAAQADTAGIRTVAEDYQGDSKDLLAILAGMLERTRQVYADQEGQCTELDAVQALTKKGSCTSCANLVAALLRANGIPARILAGYPAWCGPLQTHYLVEAYVPGFGWYPIEPSLLRAPWPNFEQIAVAILPPESEDNSAPRPAAAGGVPYLSLTEHVPSDAPVRTLGTLGAPNTFCDHECRPVRNFAESTTPETWDRLKRSARAKWNAWLKAQSTSQTMPPPELHKPEWYRTAPEEDVKHSLLQD